MALRPSEWVIAAFFTWVTCLSLILPDPGILRLQITLANALVAVGYVLLLRYRNHLSVEYLRDWIPQALAILAYKEMGWFARAPHTYRLENQWIVWDRVVLDEWHGRMMVELLGGVLPSILEISYSLVYAVPPLTMLLLYVRGLRPRADIFLTVYLLSLFLCYGQFPFWPSHPPRTVFALQDLPSVQTVFRDFNLWLVGNYGIHTSVFPSAHVSGVFGAAFSILTLMPRNRGVVLVCFVYAILVACATVYGRYHYAVDAVAGLAAATIAWPLGIWLTSRTPKTDTI